MMICPTCKGEKQISLIVTGEKEQCPTCMGTGGVSKLPEEIALVEICEQLRQINENQKEIIRMGKEETDKRYEFMNGLSKATIEIVSNALKSDFKSFKKKKGRK